MFERITLHGESGSLLWGYRTAATVTDWKIRREKDTPEWKLTATVRQVDAFQARQRPLLFTAPRDKGRWCWEVQQVYLNERELTATLGQPVQ